jgi:hypothetical protein
MNSSQCFVFPVVLLAGTVMGAQPKGDVAIDVVVIQVGTGYKQSLSVSSPDLPGLFRALATDARAHVLTRSQLHISDGNKGQLDLGNISVGRESPSVRQAVSIEITPQIQNKDELLLQVQFVFQRAIQYVSPDGRSQPAFARHRTTLNTRLRDGQMSVFDGGSVDLSADRGIPNLSLFGTPSDELMLSLSPHIELSR